MTDKQKAVLQGDGPIDIVRYGNRKLYVQSLGYVELPFLQECLRRARPVCVRSHATGEDETALVFGRMLVEAAKARRAPLGQMRSLLEEIYAEPAAPSPR